MNPIKVAKFFVHFWLALTMASLIYAFFITFDKGWDALVYFVPTSIAAFQFYVRRKMYLRLLNKQDSNQQ
jgi:hypothetical protein